jgi:hypothetical protein
MGDDTVQKIVSVIIDKSKLFKEKKRKSIRDRIGKLANKDFPEAMARQAEIEEKVKNRLHVIDTHKTFRQFLNPTLQSEYKKDTNPLQVLFWYASEANEKSSGLTDKEKLALNLCRKHKSKIVAAIKAALKELDKVTEYCKKAPAPQYPLRTVSYQRVEYEDMLHFFRKKL